MENNDKKIDLDAHIKNFFFIPCLAVDVTIDKQNKVQLLIEFCIFYFCVSLAIGNIKQEDVRITYLTRLFKNCYFHLHFRRFTIIPFIGIFTKEIDLPGFKHNIVFYTIHLNWLLFSIDWEFYNNLKNGKK